MQSTLTARPLRSPRGEATLVDAARDGDDRAFEELYARYRERIGGYILSRVHDAGRAEDIAQEVFISALRQLRASDQRIAFKPWLYAIAKNACIDEFRRAGRGREVPLESDEALTAGDGPRPLLSLMATPAAAVESKQRLDDLRGAFGGLSESHHRLLVMREFEGLSYDEIGERLGMNRQMVESGLHRARRKLTEEYDELASGRRCTQIQTAIEAGSARSARALGIRERRRFSRHLAHCQACRRYARLGGVDETLLKPGRIAAGIAVVLPIPLWRWPWRGHGARLSASHHLAAGTLQNAAQLAEPAGASGGLAPAAAVAAALAIAGTGGGLLATQGGGSAHHRGAGAGTAHHAVAHRRSVGTSAPPLVRPARGSDHPGARARGRHASRTAAGGGRHRLRVAAPGTAVGAATHGATTRTHGPGTGISTLPGRPVPTTHAPTSGPIHHPVRTTTGGGGTTTTGGGGGGGTTATGGGGSGGGGGATGGSDAKAATGATSATGGGGSTTTTGGSPPAAPVSTAPVTNPVQTTVGTVVSGATTVVQQTTEALGKTVTAVTQPIVGTVQHTVGALLPPAGGSGSTGTSSAGAQNPVSGVVSTVGATVNGLTGLLSGHK